MEDKLLKLYNQCINELNSINISTTNIGNIDIKISKRDTRRYGCCKQESPDKHFKKVIRKGFRKIIRYEKFDKHHIEISKWVMALEDNIIKNTIMHEIIHCFPYCNNHGEEFKKYAKEINNKLEYNITRIGNKEEDFKKSNIEYKENKSYKYIIKCERCTQIFYRQRINKNFTSKYRCGKCGSKFIVNNI